MSAVELQPLPAQLVSTTQQVLFQSQSSVIFTITSHGTCCCTTPSQNYEVGISRFSIYDKYVHSVKILNYTTNSFTSAWQKAQSGCCFRGYEGGAPSQGEHQVVRRDEIVYLSSSEGTSPDLNRIITGKAGRCACCCCYTPPHVFRHYGNQTAVDMAIRTKDKEFSFGVPTEHAELVCRTIMTEAAPQFMQA